LANKVLTGLSEQQLVDCNYGRDGCDGWLRIFFGL
jgi:hypothetical protein